MNNLYLVLPVLVGALIPIQAKLNGKLFSINQNAIFTSLISVIASGLVIMTVYVSTTRVMPSLRAPWWLYTGGLVGALYLVGLAWVAAKVSATQMIAGLLCGQMIMALIIDYFLNGKISTNQVIATGLVLAAVCMRK